MNNPDVPVPGVMDFAHCSVMTVCGLVLSASPSIARCTRLIALTLEGL